MWEYASVDFQDVKRKITKEDPEYARLPASVRSQWEEQDWPFYWWREWTFYIWLPGVATPEIRVAWCPAQSARKTSSLEILNELGEQGWELVAKLITNTAMVSDVPGWDPAGFPIGYQMTLKRPKST